MISDISKTYTVEQFIDAGSTDIFEYENLSIYIKNKDNILLPNYNILNDFLDELRELSVNINMSDSEFNKYKYKPKLLAYDIYGSQELYFVILLLNGIPSIKEFNRRRIKVLPKKTIEEVLSYIYNSQKDIISKNRSKLGI